MEGAQHASPREPDYSSEKKLKVESGALKQLDNTPLKNIKELLSKPTGELFPDIDGGEDQTDITDEDNDGMEGIQEERAETGGVASGDDSPPSTPGEGAPGGGDDSSIDGECCCLECITS